MSNLKIMALTLVGLLLIACQPVATLQPTPEAQTVAVASPTPAPTDTPLSPSPTTPPFPEPSPSPTVAPTAQPTPPPEGGKGNADVLHVRAVRAADGSWTFHVTVQHPDTGWEDYADGWDVVTPDGTVLKADPDSPFTRLLLHPHVGEQPFTRSQSGIAIPAGVEQVRVRAHDLVDGWGGREIVVDLSRSSGPGFEVER